jgi:hypothetical protein
MFRLQISLRFVVVLKKLQTYYIPALNFQPIPVSPEINRLILWGRFAG